MTGKRIVMLGVALAGVLAGMLYGPHRAEAVASCSTVSITSPARTSGGGGFYLKSQATVKGCSAQFYFLTTLLVESGGAYVESGCDGSPVPACAQAWPTTGGTCGATKFCAYTSVVRYPTWNQNGSMCGRNWRARIIVYNPTGDEIGRDTSATFRC